jgi:hypothetical protein
MITLVPGNFLVEIHYDLDGKIRSLEQVNGKPRVFLFEEEAKAYLAENYLHGEVKDARNRFSHLSIN